MARDHYYLVASLPSLKLNDRPPLGSAEFLERCRPWLDRSEMAVVEGATLDEPFAAGGGEAASAAWKDFETSLRNELAAVRAKGMNADPRPFLRPAEDAYAVIPMRVNEAMHDESPLNAEKRLIAFRWEFLDDLEAGHHFDLAFLVVYRLKLLLLERLALFDREKGMRVFEALYRGGQPGR